MSVADRRERRTGLRRARPRSLSLPYPPVFSDVSEAWTAAELCAAAALAIGLKSPSESLVCEVCTLADL